MFKRSVLLAWLVAVVAGTAVAPSGARAEFGSVHCSQFINMKAKNGANLNVLTQTSTPQNIPSAKIALTVPAGQIYCIKLRFSAVALCNTMTGDHCYIKPFDLDTMFSPFAPVAVAFTSSPEASSQSFEWVAVLNAGPHTIQMRAYSDMGVDFLMSGWTMVVDILK